MIPLSHPLGRRWYLVHTERNKEIHAFNAISAIELDCYCPKETHFARHGRRLERVTLPLFRGYLFARFDVDRDPWPDINRSPAVKEIVSANEIPLRVPDRQVELISEAEQAGLYDATNKDEAEPFPPGAPVRIVDGPFLGRLATVHKLRPQQRIEVLFDILGQGVRLTVERYRLALIEKSG